MQQIFIKFQKIKVAVVTRFSVAAQKANTCSDSIVETQGKGVKCSKLTTKTSE